MIDSNGNKIWNKTWGGSSYDDDPHTIRLSTGDYIVCGQSSSDSATGEKTVANYGATDYWAVKLDSLGNNIWDKVYGGSGVESAVNGERLSLLADAEGNFIIAGSTTSPADGLVSDSSRGLTDFWIIKIDSAGNRIWDKRYGGNKQDFCQFIQHTDEGGFMVCGYTSSDQGLDVSDTSRGAGLGDAWIIKLDSLGNKQWDKRYGGNNGDQANWIEPALGGGYWVSGYTSSDVSGEVSESPYGARDYWIFKIDNAGNKLWDKRFGGPGVNEGSNFVIMPDTSIFLFGYAGSGTSAVKTDSGKGGSDYWLVHFKYTDPVFVGENELAISHLQLSISPNPVKDNCTLTCAVNNATLVLYDITGRVMLQQPFNGRATLDISTLANGVYIAEVKDIPIAIGRSVKGKLVKE